MGRSKYRNRKTEIDGIVFDSQLEANHYLALRQRLDDGEIEDLMLQPVYHLQEAFTYRGKRIRAIDYIADFQFVENGQIVAFDSKGVEPAIFKLKLKLAQHKFPHVEFRIVKKD